MHQKRIGTVALEILMGHQMENTQPATIHWPNGQKSDGQMGGIVYHPFAPFFGGQQRPHIAQQIVADERIGISAEMVNDFLNDLQLFKMYVSIPRWNVPAHYDYRGCFIHRGIELRVHVGGVGYGGFVWCGSFGKNLFMELIDPFSFFFIHGNDHEYATFYKPE